MHAAHRQGFWYTQGVKCDDKNDGLGSYSCAKNGVDAFRHKVRRGSSPTCGGLRRFWWRRGRTPPRRLALFLVPVGAGITLRTIPVTIGSPVVFTPSSLLACWRRSCIGWWSSGKLCLRWRSKGRWGRWGPLSSLSCFPPFPAPLVSPFLLLSAPVLPLAALSASRAFTFCSQKFFRLSVFSLPMISWVYLHFLCGQPWRVWNGMQICPLT